jgi:hypothetical protein
MVQESNALDRPAAESYGPLKPLPFIPILGQLTAQGNGFTIPPRPVLLTIIHVMHKCISGGQVGD